MEANKSAKAQHEQNMFNSQSSEKATTLKGAKVDLSNLWGILNVIYCMIL